MTATLFLAISGTIITICGIIIFYRARCELQRQKEAVAHTNEMRAIQGERLDRLAERVSDLERRERNAAAWR